MPFDALLSAGTVSGSVTTTMGTVDLHGTPNRGLVCRFVQTAGSAVGGTAKVWGSIDHSDDASTWHVLANGTADAFSLTSAGGIVGEAWLGFRTSKRYVRPSFNLAGGGTPTFTAFAEIGPAKP
jgi:hypothetical protein